MRYKKIMMLTLIFTCLLAVSTVSAAENATDDVVSVEKTHDNVVSVAENQVIEKQNNDFIISEKDNGTFTALENKIKNAPSGSTIYLENDYCWDESDHHQYDYSDHIYIDHAITIEGNGHKIDGLGKTQIFYIIDADVILNNIQFYNGNTTYAGGAILFASGNLIVSNSTFVNNYAEYGGAIDFRSGVIKISDCVFINNYGLVNESNTISGGEGGALNFGYSGSPSLTEITNCEFKNNVAGRGGAIYVSYQYEGTFNIKNSNFTQNRIFYTGGAIDWWSSCELNIYDSVFKGNEWDGICSWSGDVIVHDGIFEDIATKDYVKFVTTPKSNDKQSSSSSSNYSSGSQTNVTKTTPKLTAKKVTFKVKTKTKKYSVTLKTNKNKAMKNTRITLKVNKETFKVKTNSKGKATFKITNLKKKGTYTAVVKYAGSKYYNSKTVKTKIVVK